jgi:hypothetical protein
MYPKQPFDIAGRTGTVVFDVSADAIGPHSSWPEFWWTDQPVPAPGANIPAQKPYAQNSIGYSIASDRCHDSNKTGVYEIMMTRSYQFSVVPMTDVACVTKGSATGAMNHFETRISESRIEVWGTDAGSTNLKLLAYADVTMPMTRGVIWIEDVHYNACKESLGSQQCDHTLAWDNVGFDGPTPYRDLTFDVQDADDGNGNGNTSLGYKITQDPTSFTAPGVYWLQNPTKAYIAFNWFADQTTVPSVRINGGPWHTLTWPFDTTTSTWRTIAIPIPPNEIKPGNNTIEYTSPNNTVISNTNIILIAASP